MHTLSQIARMESQNLGSDSVFMLLLDIALPDNGEILRFTSNNEDTVWPAPDGESYISFPFELDNIAETRKNEVQSLTAKVGNITRQVQYYVEQSNGGVGADVILRVVNSKNLMSETPEMQIPFQVTGCTCDSKWVTFTLGATNPFQSRFPQNRCIQDYCRWKFKSLYCGYTGSFTFCNKTVLACRERNNTARFGGFPGMSKDAVRI